MSYSNTNKFAALFAPAKGSSAKQPPPKALDEKIAEVKKINETEKKSAAVDRKKTENKPATRGGQRGGRGGARNTEGRPPRPAGATEERTPSTEPQEEAYARQKRQFDRRSGTGRNPTEQKKGNYGKGNWGTEKDAVAGDKEGVEVVEGTTEETVVEEVPEVKTFTLAEFEKQQQDNAVKVDRPAPRVVEVDSELLKKFTKLEKKGTTDKAPKKEQKETKEKVNKKQVVPLNEILDVKVPQPQNDRFTRGQKGGKKPAQRGNRTQFTYDEGAFPKLG